MTGYISTLTFTRTRPSPTPRATWMTTVRRLLSPQGLRLTSARGPFLLEAIYYDIQMIGMWLYLGQKDMARSYLKVHTIGRMELQIRRDGIQPRELRKIHSWDSSLLALRAWIILASQADTVRIDLFRVQPPGARSCPQSREIERL